MQDRFRFRAWFKTKKEMSYDTELTYDYFIGVGTESHNNFGDVLEDENYIVMQSTGLKDRNKKLIYEGDVVKIPDDYDEYGMMADEVREVYFKDGGFRLKPKSKFQIKKGARGHWLEDNNVYEILGNIYENPELLKVEE